MTIEQIDIAAAALAAAKHNEAQARQARLAAEAALLALVAAKEEGSVTVRGELYKTTVTFSINRSLDPAALEAVRGVIPPALFEQAIAYKPEIVLAGLRHLRNNEPDTYAVLAQAITAKSAKPSVTVELIPTALAA